MLPLHRFRCTARASTAGSPPPSFGTHPRSRALAFRSRSRGRRGIRWALALALILVGALGAGSAVAQPGGHDALAAARSAAAAAREAGVIASVDQPAWRRAVDLALAAERERPGDPEVLRFQARLYGEIRWYIRAWEAWQELFAIGGGFEPAAADPAFPSDAAMFAEAGTELGFARYEADDPEAALAYYAGVLERIPDEAEALRWMGRIHLEEGRPAEALPYWERLASLRPDAEGVAYYLDLTRERIAVGQAASSAFQRGIERYEAGDLEAALEAFEAAIAANATFLEAHVWAGRSALELGRPVRAVRHWSNVLERDPDDGRARYFLRVARDQIRWGVEAALAFYDGQAAYERGDLDAARAAFERAAEANPSYKEAWVWAARTAQEAGEPADAIVGWTAVLRLDPEDARARFFLSQAEQQLAYGVEAGAAYAEGIQAFQLADFAAAEAAFRKAVEVDPDFAEAWAWLGRVAFTQTRYADAADAYARAAELDPDNDDVAFFLDESRRLAGE